MSTTSAPVWSAPHNGVIGDASAMAGAGQINQFLGTHADQVIYQGNSILTPFGTGGLAWAYALATTDLDQPFTMSGTSIGHVTVPLLPVGDGADLLMSLWSDNGSGLPGSMIVQTRLPASWITQLASVAASSTPAAQIPPTALTGNPLAAGQFNTLHLSNVTGTPWPYPYVTSTAAPSATFYGGCIIQIGGVASSATISNVYTIPFAGAGSAGTLSEAIPQASFPVAIDGSNKTCVALDSVTGSPVVVTVGGSSTFEGTPTGNVYTSSLTAATGSLSAWSQQTSLPYNVQNQGICSYNGYVYTIGGLASAATLSTVSYAQVSNGQITAWSTTTPLPSALQIPYTIAVNGFLFVIGGANATFGTSYSTVWYAAINSNGSLGPWMPGPVLPATVGNLNQTVFANGNVIHVAANGVGAVYGLGVTANGPAPTWMAQNFGGWEFTGYQDQGNGSITIFGLNSTSYNVAQLALTPMIPVPLPASGLTSGATYHVMLQQQGGDESSYLRTHADHNAFPGDPTAFGSPPGAYTWTPRSAGYGIPLQIFDNTVSDMPLHLWEDNGSKITTFVNATTPDGRLLGVLEATRQAYALNANTGFESGISPWQCFGGTVAQSSAEVYNGQFSAQVTPSGTAAQVFLDSEMLPCVPGQSVTVTGWFYFTSAVTGFSLSANWYSLAGSLISTASNTISVPAGTWTQVTNTFTVPTTGTAAYQFTLNPTLGSTPPASLLWYVDTCHAHPTFTGPQNTTVTMVNYNGTYPDPFPGVGTTVLA